MCLFCACMCFQFPVLRFPSSQYIEPQSLRYQPPTSNICAQLVPNELRLIVLPNLHSFQHLALWLVVNKWRKMDTVKCSRSTWLCWKGGWKHKIGNAFEPKLCAIHNTIFQSRAVTCSWIILISIKGKEGVKLYEVCFKSKVTLLRSREICGHYTWNLEGRPRSH